jgi:hypothetical protein
MDRKLWNDPAEERVLLDGVTLGRKDALAIRDARGAVLFVDRGEVWLTQERDSRDILLATGRWFRLDRDGTAIVQARRAAAVTLTVGADVPLAEIETLTAGGQAAAPRRRRGSLLRALAAWWLRLYRRPRALARRRFAVGL